MDTVRLAACARIGERACPVVSVVKEVAVTLAGFHGDVGAPPAPFVGPLHRVVGAVDDELDVMCTWSPDFELLSGTHGLHTK